MDNNDSSDDNNTNNGEETTVSSTTTAAFPTLDPEEPVEWPSKDRLETLLTEIAAHLRVIQHIEKIAHRDQFLNELNRLVRKHWPRHSPQLHLFGSTANNLCVGQGDVDLCLTIAEEAGTRAEVIEQLGELLTNCSMQQVQVLAKARIPIVRFRDPRSKLACDVCCNNTLALRNTAMLGDYAAIDPRMRPLVFAVKSWAKRRLLNDPYHGSLSSYAYVLLVVFFLQTRSPPILPCLQELHRPADPADLPIVENFDVYYYSKISDLLSFGQANSSTLSDLLLGFFRFYGWDFDFEHQVISVRKGRALTREEKGWETCKASVRMYYFFALEDPFEVSHNLGKAVNWRPFRLLSREFRRAYRTLATQSFRSAYVKKTGFAEKRAQS